MRVKESNKNVVIMFLNMRLRTTFEITLHTDLQVLMIEVSAKYWVDSD